MKPSGDCLHATDYATYNISQREASGLVRQWHYSKSTANTSVYRHGLFRIGLFEPCQGVAMWQPPTRTVGIHINPCNPQGVLNLSRFVIDPELPTNAASFLLGASMRLINRQRWPVLLTYADTSQGHTGAIYRATNWTMDGYSDSGDVWILPNGSQCGRRRGPINLTRAQMKALGATPIVARKIRFIHRVAA